MPEDTAPPYSSEKLDAQLNAATNIAGNEADDAPHITRAAIVGALLDKDYNLYHDDYKTIRRALNVLRSAHIKISSSIQFDFYNLFAPIKSDFLRAALIDHTAPPADLVVICGIFGSRNPINVIDHVPAPQRDEPPVFTGAYTSEFTGAYNPFRETSISFLQVSPETWPMAAHAIGAKFVVTRGPTNDTDAVTSNHFMVGDWYKVAMPTSAYFEHVSAIIDGPLGIMVRTDALDDIKASVYKNNPLGKRILVL